MIKNHNMGPPSHTIANKKSPCAFLLFEPMLTLIIPCGLSIIYLYVSLFYCHDGSNIVIIIIGIWGKKQNVNDALEEEKEEFMNKIEDLRTELSQQTEKYTTQIKELQSQLNDRAKHDDQFNELVQRVTALGKLVDEQFQLSSTTITTTSSFESVIEDVNKIHDALNGKLNEWNQLNEMIVWSIHAMNKKQVDENASQFESIKVCCCCCCCCCCCDCVFIDGWSLHSL
jgi:uncharacterized phage infection (PIP) family protein YhgE